MSEYLFSYGTLQPGLAPDEIAPSVSQLAEVGKGVVRGVLYDLGDYPGAILEPLSEFEILGTVYRLPQDEEVLRRIDAYEAYYPESPEKSLFLRVVSPVKFDSGMTVPCWIYVYNGAMGGARILEDGQFVKPRDGEGSKP
jgi:gamma-glutamylcyclotransferase (GGCT)/AIG2-like uncharacterized protein YtfP